MPRRRITFSRNVFLPLTTVCRNRCAYCGFRRPVGPGCLMRPGEVGTVLDEGARTGCTEALFTFGERPEEVPGFGAELGAVGEVSVLDYCRRLCVDAIGRGLLPHTNAGVLDEDELSSLAEVNASMGLMLETTARVKAHEGSPGKDPAARLATIEAAGRLRIPFTTGLLLGIGETAADRLESLESIAALQRRYGHIQEVILQNFAPQDGTGMAGASTIGPAEYCATVRLAREVLPAEVAVQVPPNLADAAALVRCGADDLGGVSPCSIDHINPNHPWPAVDELRRAVAPDAELVERLCIHPRFVDRGWYSTTLAPLVRRLSERIREQQQ
ncbi:MAG TPA: 7,8-didemethyl-8-hydroxy-5-deazariboflavin synthase subunit CofG [Methanoregulaceae archaeon]|nr:7,8-didemethyl-8-hydroxy-5-deazariboflavin synthase subunit CofG [Methanoregulaceae archaeon]